MNRKFCLIFVVCLAVILVKSESTIEVDENGDEYDVKRFHIQGRQLNEGHSQCVVTRRKRATQPRPMYSDDGINDAIEDENDAYNIRGEEQQAILVYSPTAVAATAIEDGDDGQQNEESEMNKNKEEEEDELMNSMQESNQNRTEENIEVVEDKQKEENYNENDTFEIIQLHQLPVLSQLQSDSESAAEITLASDAAPADNNGIVVVQSIDPPKVNPQTHAVFKLVPVNNYDDELEEGEHEAVDNEAENAGSEFDFEEELNPVTTTAFWSTGDDSLSDFYNNYDLKPIKVEKVVKKYRKPLKANKKKRKTSMETNNSFRDGLKKRNKKKNNNKRFQNGNRVQRPVRKRGQHKNKVNVMRDQTNKRKRNKNLKNSISYKKHRNLNTRNKFITKRNKNKNKADIVDQGANTVTRTMITTQTGNEDDEKNVNCIIIPKDPPPTTPRPFWNLLGRSANGVPQASGHFGKRKRVNMRFVA